VYRQQICHGLLAFHQFFYDNGLRLLLPPDRSPQGEIDRLSSGMTGQGLSPAAGAHLTGRFSTAFDSMEK
jgi:hypothetical protein